jgi:hypothetical protein
MSKWNEWEKSWRCCSSPIPCLIKLRVLFICWKGGGLKFFLLWYWGLNSRAHAFLINATRVITPTIFSFNYFSDRVSCFCPGANLGQQSSSLCLLPFAGIIGVRHCAWLKSLFKKAKQSMTTHLNVSLKVFRFYTCAHYIDRYIHVYIQAGTFNVCMHLHTSMYVYACLLHAYTCICTHISSSPHVISPRL